MKTILYIFILTFCCIAFAEESFSIEGHFPKFPNSNFELKGYDGLQQKILANSTSGQDGKFVLSYPKEYKGVAQLFMNGAYLNLVFLNQENITLYWEDLTNRENLKTNSKEYEAFLGGMKAFQESEAKLAGLFYLLSLYEKDTIKQKWIGEELEFVDNSFPTYIKSLPKNLYVQQYLLTKGLIEQMPKTVETYKWRSLAHVPEFMAIDFKVLKHSGLYTEIINGFTNLIERFSAEEIYPILNLAIDKVILELKDDPTIEQEVAQMWFSLLEQKNMIPAAEHLALLMLNQENCILDPKSKDMFEQYRLLAIGKTAPNINFIIGQAKKKKDLKSLNNNYKLVVFGASWCPNCRTDYPKLKEKYDALKEKYNLEIVYISVDTDINVFNDYYKEASFITYCDTKGWETQAAKDYHVYATPNYILLDKNLKILLRIQSPDHLETWLKRKG